MAQTIKLKRSATTGKVPSTSNLALGELAVNTYDGRIFFKKNDGSDSIEHIVTTDSVTTGSITIIGTTQTTTLTTTNRIDKQYLDDEVLNTSLNSFTQSAITVTGNGTSDLIPVFSGTHTVINSKIETGDTSTTLRHSNNGNTIFTISGSNGELLTVTDSNSGNLLEVNDSSGIDVFTVAANGDVSASGAVTASGITGLTSLSVGGTTTTNNLTLSSLSGQSSEKTALMINGSNVVGTRELGDNAFNSTAFVTADVTLTTAAQPNITSLGTLTTLTVDDVTINGSTISDSGDLTLDIGGDLNIDVDGADIVLKDGGTAFGRFKRDTSDFIIKSEANNEDIVFRGQDGGATIDALTLDMSEAGSATFHGGIANAGTIAAGTWNGSVIGSAYLDSDTAHLSGTQTFTGEKTFSSGSADNTNFQNNIRAYNTILMANESSTNRWQIVNNYSGQLLGDNSFGLRYHNGSSWSSQVFNLSTSGDLEATGDVVAYASSDERLKDNIIPISNPNDKIKQIGGYEFDWNDNQTTHEGHDVGVIAQQIEKVLPELVTTRDNGYKAVKYDKLVALLIESNKELLKRIEDLESKIK